MDLTYPNNELSIDKLMLLFKDIAQSFKETDKMFQETDRKFQASEKLLTEKFHETDKKFQDTDKKFQDTDRKFKAIQEELGGIGRSNGEIAEDFFYTALEQKMEVANMRFDYIDRNLHRKRKNTEAEYDVILYNDYKVLVVEIKYNFRMKQLHDFYTEKLKRFRALFPQYSEYQLYGAVAALTFDKGVEKEAQEYGFYVLTQNNDKVKILNKNDFVPNNVK